MDYTVRKAEVDLIALEGQIASLTAVRAELESRSISQGLALECDALLHANRGQGSLLALHYNYDTASQDYQVALEGVISTVWETIKLIIRKIIEYIKKFWMWLTGKSNQVTVEKAEAAEKSAEQFKDVWDQIFERLGEGASGKVTAYDEKGNGTTVEFKDGKRVGAAPDAELEAIKQRTAATNAETERLKADLPKIKERGDDAVNLIKEHGPEKASQMIQEKYGKRDDKPMKVDEMFNRRQGGESQKVPDEGNLQKKTGKSRTLFDDLTSGGKSLEEGLDDFYHKHLPASDEPVAPKVTAGADDVDFKETSRGVKPATAPKKDDGQRAKLSGVATEGISLEDAGIGRQKPVDILNMTAESMKSQFLSGLSRPEAMILFSKNYGQGLEQLAREFAHLKPIEALALRYQQLNQALPTYVGEATQIDTIKDPSERQQKIADFQHRMEQGLNQAMGRENGETDDADQLANDVKRFHAARESHGSGDFEIDTPAAGDQLMHVATITANTFRTVKAVITEVQSAAAELKKLEGQLEELSGKIVKLSASDGASAKDYVAHRLNSEVRIVSMRVRTIVQGMAVFTNYYSDAHKAVSRYQKFVIRVVEASLKQMTGEFEFQEEQLKSALAHLRDAAMSFDRLSA